MATEAGHFPNRVYTDAQGAIHLNGSSFFNDAESDISSQLEELANSAAAQAIAGIKTFTNGAQVGSVAVTATVGGGTTGLIPAGSSHVTITSDTATKQVSLPAASVGHKMTLFIGATGCELISAVAAHEINGVVVGATNELALGANTHYHAEYVATNKWIVRGFDASGADQAALVPDSL